MNHPASSIVIVAAVSALSAPAWAYFGPGAGITMLGALWGVLLAVLFAVGAVLFWPIRALLRRRRAVAETVDEAAEPAAGEDQAPDKPLP